ncbi:MAG TPA: amidohydrolase, partial [Acidobacteriota bacterium]|nr:amidohydrolase [Acidobacteriota bacterium]
NGFPHKKILDELFPDNPVVLNSHDEHMLWVNSQTLKQTGILVPAKLGGAYFGTDPDGSLNGVIGENAIPLIRNHIPKPDFEQRRHLLLQVQKKLHRLGVVGLHSMDANAAFGDLQQLNRKNELRLRVFHSIPIRQLEEAVRIGLRTGLGDSFFRFGLVKIFSDGTLGSRTASMLEPYNEAGGTGIETIAEPDLVEKMRLALQNGIAVAVHAIGDKANRSVLNAFEQNQPWLGVPGAASRVEHAQLLHPHDVARFGKLGIFASMQPIHAISDQPLAAKFWGERARYSYAWRSLLESQATLLFGSDAPVEDPDPLLGLAAAIERSGWEDKRQTISASEAIAAYTRQPAAAEGQANERGSIEAGKLADLAILSEDPANTATSNIRVVATIVDGEFVYRDF